MRGLFRSGKMDVSDIVQYLYCPRKLYFLKIAGIRISKPKMEEGKAAQEEARGKLRSFARKLKGELLTSVYLESKRYGLKGVLDALVIVDGGAFPVDVKLTRFQSITYAWKMQLTAYALLVEENYAVEVRKGYLFLLNQGKFVEVSISPDDRKALLRIIKEIERLIEEEKYPRTSKSKKCGYCEVREFCV
ncbi:MULTISPECIES: CRISPR-associated protein Cas4 [Archaeoglobus]|uniref:CRISPR-associated exonuclease Cas4 n=3 Tax=Archaeoglobus fulgidus TaxID=2234 RepID=O28402_ARCFU|nr:MULTISPECIES: CRISPR-associated protein Cas4 [Archaeoglobus]AAB89375.1 conserved hypothetical protein [Archaeoglobus fulgidus DSM 4304]